MPRAAVGGRRILLLLPLLRGVHPILHAVLLLLLLVRRGEPRGEMLLLLLVTRGEGPLGMLLLLLAAVQRSGPPCSFLSQPLVLPLERPQLQTLSPFLFVLLPPPSLPVGWSAAGGLLPCERKPSEERAYWLAGESTFEAAAAAVVLKQAPHCHACRKKHQQHGNYSCCILLPPCKKFSIQFLLPLIPQKTHIS